MKTKGHLLHENCVTCPHVTSFKTRKLSKAIESSVDYKNTTTKQSLFGIGQLAIEKPLCIQGILAFL
jgi:hypothetical protein